MKLWLKILLSAIFKRLHPNFYATVDPNAKCPACGHRNGKIRFVWTESKDRGAVEHQCQVCHALFYEPTVMKMEKWCDPRASQART